MAPKCHWLNYLTEITKWTHICGHKVIQKMTSQVKIKNGYFILAKKQHRLQILVYI